MKVADSCMDTSVNIQLFVEILNEYLYYFETNPEVVSPSGTILLLEFYLIDGV